MQVSLQTGRSNGYFTLRPMYIYDSISMNYYYNEKCFRRKLQRKSKHVFLCSITFFRKSCRLSDNVGKFGIERQATYDNTKQSMRNA